MFIKICNRAIEYLFYALFFFVPLIFLPVNYELFEFNKMVLTYAITVLIGTFWGIKIVSQGRIAIQRTPLDIPIILFLVSQIISTIQSTDMHTSVWGYYSRFNGGLASILCYIFLYYAFVSNFDKEKVKRLLLIALASGIVVSIYGILEHFGVDKDYWVQDVQNRVFSTLGQPNWLAAYLSVLIPISIAFAINSKFEYRNSKQIQILNFKSQIFSLFHNSYFILLTSLFYITLLYTKSRSGFLGFWIGIGVFIGTYYFFKSRISKHFILNTKYLILNTLLLVVITFLVGSPLEQLNKFTFQSISSQQEARSKKQEAVKPQGTALEVGGGTESGEIRKIVWRGALDIAKHYPLFGTGVETFAYSYYRFRPVEHNQTSEWDFLYNKAHNEYLNYLANTGIFGLGSYLSIIIWFLFVSLKQLKTQMSKLKSTTQNSKLPEEKFLDLRFGFELCVLSLALIAGYASILVSNFFGFSVVIINIFFFLIPAFVFVFSGQLNHEKAFMFSLAFLNSRVKISNFVRPVGGSNFFLTFILLISYFLLLFVYRMWDADRSFATGKSLDRSGEYGEAYGHLVAAVKKRGGEPQFYDELSVNTAALAIAALEQNESTLSGQFEKEAIRRSDYAVKKGPNNPNFWRTRIRVFYTLSQIDEIYTQEALTAAKKATELSPTDPKIGYNYGLILGQDGQLDEAIRELERTVALKPDYRDPVYALGLFYYENATDAKGKVINQELVNKAIFQMEAVLKISSEDAEAREKLREWRGF